MFSGQSSHRKKSPVIKERLLHATTSLRWLQYHEDKLKLKTQNEEVKRGKALLRKRKKRREARESQLQTTKMMQKNQKTYS